MARQASPQRPAQAVTLRLGDSFFAPALLAAISLLAPATANAQTPQGTAFTYQGALYDNGLPANGNYDLRFALFDAVVGGNAVGAVVCIEGVAVTDGLFTIALDFGAQFAGQERFLEIAVRPAAGRGCNQPAGFVTLAPRQPLTAAPTALYALDAGALKARPVSGAAPGSGQVLKWNGASWAPGADTLQLPYSNSSSSLSAFKITNTSSSADSTALHGAHSGTGGTSAAVRGEHTGPGGFQAGVWGSHATSGIGVYGQTFGGAAVYGAALGIGAGQNFGAIFEANSNSGRGVYAYAIAESPAANHGGYFWALGESGRGVFAAGENSTGTNYGLWATSRGNSGRGVLGQALSPSGSTFAGRFEALSPAARGVLGLATATSGDAIGVFAQSNSTAGRGLYAWSTATSGTTYGVYGRCDSPAGWAVYAEGALGASGTKSFCIDHPDDPENQHLLHYSSESPEVINFYSGTVTLDGDGEAVVPLPRYFAKINRDPRYTLTAVGAPMPMLHVADEISTIALRAGAECAPGQLAPPCAFRIAGGAAHGRVSWRVEAVRNDLWVRSRGAPVEVEKAESERGRYRHPALFGQPATLGMGYEAERVTENTEEHHRAATPANVP